MGESRSVVGRLCSLSLIGCFCLALGAACESDSSKGGDSDGDSTASGGSDSGPATTSATSGGTTSTGASGGTEGSTVTTGSGGTSAGGSSAGGSSAGGSSAGGSSAGGTGGDMGSGGAAGADGSTTGGTGTGVVATVGAPCTELGALACAGNRHKVTLVCGGDLEWEINETCSDTEFCDTRAGDTAGLCLEAIDACLTRQPGDPFCDGDVLMSCGPDGVTAEVETECIDLCEDSACQDYNDPCPEGEFVDCEQDCGGANLCFGQVGCVTRATPIIDDALVPVRVPAYGGLCETECETGLRVFTVDSFVPYGQRVKATVGAPWSLASGDFVGALTCLLEDAAPDTRCRVHDWDSRDLYVFTRDPNAGPRNVTLELVDETATCP